MDISQLHKLGEVGGVPGIAIGAAVLIIGAVIAAAGVLPDAWRGPVLLASVVGAVLLGGLALVGWIRGARAGSMVAVATGDGADASNIDKTKSGGSQSATATGSGARAHNERGG